MEIPPTVFTCSTRGFVPASLRSYPTNVGTVSLAVNTNEYFNYSSKQEGADV